MVNTQPRVLISEDNLMSSKEVKIDHFRTRRARNFQFPYHDAVISAFLAMCELNSITRLARNNSQSQFDCESVYAILTATS